MEFPRELNTYDFTKRKLGAHQYRASHPGSEIDEAIVLVPNPQVFKDFSEHPGRSRLVSNAGCVPGNAGDFRLFQAKILGWDQAVSFDCQFTVVCGLPYPESQSAAQSPTVARHVNGGTKAAAAPAFTGFLAND